MHKNICHVNNMIFINYKIATTSFIISKLYIKYQEITYNYIALVIINYYK